MAAKIVPCIGAVFPFTGLLSLGLYCFYFLMILKETLMFPSLSNPVTQHIDMVTISARSIPRISNSIPVGGFDIRFRLLNWVYSKATNQATYFEWLS